MRSPSLSARIGIGLLSGLLLGILASLGGWTELVRLWVLPWGTLFLNGLKLVAAPLIVCSVLSSFASSAGWPRFGVRVVLGFLASTATAVTLGLTLCALWGPGRDLDPTARQALLDRYGGEAQQRAEQVRADREQSFVEAIAHMVPDNFAAALSDNRAMLELVVAVLVFGLALSTVPRRHTENLRAFLEGLEALLLKLVQLLLHVAPLGVLALMAALVVDVAGSSLNRLLALLKALAGYAGVLAFGFAGMLVLYALALTIGSPLGWRRFWRAFRPAMLVAFSTSSSAATLPVTLERCERELMIPQPISRFALPLGATMHMDGTALYQAVAALFIAQVLGAELGLADYLRLGLLVLLISVGTAPVPGAGVVMLVLVLEYLDLPSESVALILGIDRLVNMCRTVLNVTGDAVVATLVAFPRRSAD
ncbi:MAG: dicarboxylate/amino acid:cation symporter [Bacteroidetes bacterium]|nr:dicarboxylate/amino acid:cation symporter [Rhodothermia bacterium]MCX7907725.1 dicarboxylate/amino acid:cation symporter [Bacteroidota bacterium]MDW8137854.1 dicarboxylate/amino acid:cation symporter [Bacteroidota bacterium]MDW8286295.1 dicarboxylate/amino acid:cation symporter [Bacteroidota bacterium]